MSTFTRAVRAARTKASAWASLPGSEAAFQLMK